MCLLIITTHKSLGKLSASVAERWRNSGLDWRMSSMKVDTVTDFAVEVPTPLRRRAGRAHGSPCAFADFDPVDVGVCSRARAPQYSNGHVRATQPKPGGHSYNHQGHTRSMAIRHY